jgi:tripartite-type tricarboxylate transporter receptor subunit TctC
MKKQLAVRPQQVALFVGLVSLLMAGIGFAEYPDKPVTLVTHSSPGAGGDLFLRQLAKHLEAIVEVPLVVENRAGGASATAVSYIAASPPDGYRLYGSTPSMLQTPILTKTRHSYLDLTPLANVFLEPEILYVKGDSSWKTLPDIVDTAKKRPGELLFGAAIPGSVEHMIVHQIQSTAGVQAQPVTFEGGGELLLAVLGGHVDLGIGEFAELSAQIESGQVRPICSFTGERIPTADLPTAREQGVDIVVEKFRGLLGPKGLPPNVIAYWEQAIQKVLADPSYKEFYESNYFIPAFKDHREYKQYLDQRDQSLRKYMKEIGILR